MYSLLLGVTHPPLPYVSLGANKDVDTVFLPRLLDGLSYAIRIPKALPFGASLHYTIFVSKITIHITKDVGTKTSYKNF